MKKILYKKILYGFLAFVFGIFFVGLVSFCSADFEIYSRLTVDWQNSLVFNSTGTYTFPGCTLFAAIPGGRSLDFYTEENGEFLFTLNSSTSSNLYCFNGVTLYYVLTQGTANGATPTQYYYSGLSLGGGSSPSSINVLYNNQNSTESIICDGDNLIQIDGLSTITATNTFTPYYNIDYVDEDNQILTESYSKDILYLSGGRFKKTFTGDNEWILTIQGNENSVFTGYTPVFDVTGSTDILNTGNIFNNFSDNSLKVLLSNIPSYIQYVTIFAILMFLFGFIRRFKRKR